ncbi:hypothetical protein LSAT2_015642, partial [Lamellibrachia satsuma]
MEYVTDNSRNIGDNGVCDRQQQEHWREWCMGPATAGTLERMEYVTGNSRNIG